MYHVFWASIPHACGRPVWMDDRRSCMGGGKGFLYGHDMWRHRTNTTNPPALSLSLSPSLPLSASRGRLLSAHPSTQLHRCCYIVWSTKAQISPTGSFYSLAIASVCLTRPLMNAVVSPRSDTRQREEKPNIYPSEGYASQDSAPRRSTRSDPLYFKFSPGLR